jgi:hypothetical protein
LDPIIIELVGGTLAIAMVALMVILRSRYPVAKKMPVLTIQPSAPTSRARRRKASRIVKDKTRLVSSKPRRRARAKPIEPATDTAPPSVSPGTAVVLEACPSCGLQAPDSLLAEHFLGSPSHRNGPPKLVESEPATAKVEEAAIEDDSKQSVRSLLQMLVPPRAFGRRHAHRIVSPLSAIVKEL